MVLISLFWFSQSEIGSWLTEKMPTVHELDMELLDCLLNNQMIYCPVLNSQHSAAVLVAQSIVLIMTYACL